MVNNATMTSKDIKKITKYWVDASKHDLEVAQSLYRTGKYDYCLFLCHLMLEKLLKALVTQTSKDHPPHTHNLLYLAGKAGLDLNKAQIELFNQINKFNLEIRYPEDLKALSKRVNREYAKRYLTECKKVWKWLLNLLK